MRESLANIFDVPSGCKRRTTLPHIKTVDFDEALSRLGIGKFNYFLVLLSGVIITIASYETLGVSFVFPIAQCDLNLTTQQKGVLSGITSMGIILSSFLWGFLADTTGRKKVIIPTLVSTFVSSALSSLAPNYESLLVFRFLSGFFVSGSSATIYAYLSEFHCSTNRSRMVLSASFINGFASNYMAVLGFLLLSQKFNYNIPLLNIGYKPWRAFLMACGLPSLFCAFALLFFPESPKFLFSKGDEAGALKILNQIYVINNPNDPTGYNVNKLIDDQEFFNDMTSDVISNPFLLFLSQARTLFSSDHVKKTIIVCVVQFLMYGSCHGLYMFFPEIVDKVESYSRENPDNSSTICEIVEETFSILLETAESATCDDQIEVVTFGYALVLETLYMAGFLIITLIINRATKLSILLTILIGCGASGVGTLFARVPLASISLYIAFMLIFLGVNIVCAATCNLFPTKLRGMAVNISLMFGRIGSVTSTFIVGRTLNEYCSMTFAVSAALMFLCGFLSIFIPQIRRSEGRK